MILYIIKSICCSALLLAVYHLFLEKEKMHRFNRFYLLFSIIASFIIPLITIELKQPSQPVEDTISIINTNFTTLSEQTETVVQNNSLLPVILISIYTGIGLALLFRFIKNSAALFSKINKSITTPLANARLVLMEDNIVPHSFLRYIFLNKQQYEAGNIEAAIFEHELTHIQQKHSYDILFIEVLLVFAWFNPLLHFYKKAIRLNHEFLADDAVVNKYHNPADYQQLLLASIYRDSGLSLTSRLNYLVTKKRLVMITKKTSIQKIIGKQLLLLPVIAGITFLFSTTIQAQEAKKPPVINNSQVKPSQQNIPPEMIEQLIQEILKNYKLDTKEGWWNFHKVVTPEDRAKLELFYQRLSKELQARQKVGFMPAPAPFKKTVPSEKLFTAFKDPDIYGVWLDGKKISNDELDKYSNTDISHYLISKLYGAAKKGRRYQYQVNIMTNDYYKKYYAEAIKNKGTIMFVKWLEENTEKRILVLPETGK